MGTWGLCPLHSLSICSKSAGRVALVGLGGVGKSQLAIEFRVERELRRICDPWVDC